MNEPLATSKVAEALLAYAEEELEWGSFGEYINYIGDSTGKTFEIPGLGTVAIADYHGYNNELGYTNYVEQMHIVFEVQGYFYKATGTYASFEGSTWSDDLELVTPKQKVVTYYE